MSKQRKTVIPLLITIFFIGVLSIGALTQGVTPMKQSYEESFNAIKKLEDEQKYQQAVTEIDAVLKKAVAENNAAIWTKCLTRKVTLRLALHGYETAVKNLLEEQWPDDDYYRAVLHLFIGNTMFTYYNAYSWEINQREKVISSEEVDLKKWTAQQIFATIQDHYFQAWKMREFLEKQKITEATDYINTGNYPRDIKVTMRDFATYHWVTFLTNSVSWRPEQEHNTYLLDFEKLLASPETRSLLDEAALKTDQTHPLLKAISLLDDLYKSLTRVKRAEAALESQLERMRILNAHFTRKDQKQRIIQTLDEYLTNFRSYQWWASGQALLAGFVRDSGDLIKAREIALAASKIYPDAIGGQQCNHIVKAIEAPSFSLQHMGIDLPEERSLRLTHKNMDKIHLRAYKLDFFEWVSRRQNSPNYFNYNEIRDVVHKYRPVKEWTFPLEDVGDYKNHSTYFTLNGLDNGFYIIAASAEKDFRERDNKIEASSILLSPYITMVRDTEQGWEVRIQEGKTGVAVPDCTVSVYRFDYNKGPELIIKKRTDSEGFVNFVPQGNNRWRNIYIIAQKDDSISYDPNYLYFYQRNVQEYRSGAFVYTDRSIYRPLQTLYYKVVAYEGNYKEGTYHAAEKKTFTVRFLDPNRKEIETQQITTNTFGTASGTFIIPKGRLLGGYQIVAQYGNNYGYSNVRVEEYKRPTFEASLDTPKEQLLLNQEATLKGTAKYYFGLPVSTGKVTYRITRAPVYPWWYSWWYGSFYNQAREAEIAAGEAKLEEDGSFSVSFIPKADPDVTDKKSVSYSFKIHAEVTDEGGETRTASSHIRIGYCAVETTLTADKPFYEPEQNIQISLYRRNLSGEPQGGAGQYQLYQLKQPDAPVRPSEIPIMVPEGVKHTAGDLLRPRWEGSHSMQNRFFRWADGEQIKDGSLDHGPDGKSLIDLKNMDAGVYRIRYQTKDNWNNEFTTQFEFLIIDEKKPLNLPFYCLVQNSYVDVGQEAEIIFGSGWKNQPFSLEIYQSGVMQKRYLYISRGYPERLKIPIEEKHRGGLSVQLIGLNDVFLDTQLQNIVVPWSNKQLNIAFESFRDKLRPGQEETWTVKVSGPDNTKVAAELLAYMYDRSLDFFVPHSYPSISSLYPSKYGTSSLRSNIRTQSAQSILSYSWYSLPGFPGVYGPSFIQVSGYGIGGPGGRRMYREGFAMVSESKSMAPPAPASMARDEEAAPEVLMEKGDSTAQAGSKAENLNGISESDDMSDGSGMGEAEAPQVRSNFSETAFFQPHLITDENGIVKIEFQVPDSVTSWKVYVHAMTNDLKYMTSQKETVTVKELMVRPYMPRFLRENDKAELKVVVNNASDKKMSGTVELAIIDPDTEEDKSRDFGLTRVSQPFSADSQKSDNVTWTLNAPPRIGSYAFRVIARSGTISDGELRPIPVLPSRIHLMQSRFATLKEGQTRILELKDLYTADQDPTLIHDQFIVTLDTQLIYSVLKALPYLVNYPYECVEQTLNRYLSTSIVSSLYDGYPAIKKMAQQFSERKTQYAAWHKDDPNRKMALEETPWLAMSGGGNRSEDQLINVLDYDIAKAQKENSLEKLRKAQLSSGAFPWWSGGPPSPYMTLYIMYGFSKAQEFDVDVPRDMVQNGWRYLYSHYLDYYEKRIVIEDFGYHYITFLNYVLSCYPDSSYYQGTFTEKERQQMLDFSFRYWKDHNPYLKGYLTLTLQRMNRKKDAILVLDSIMDSAVTKQDQGTFWAPEDRGWLWYNDNIESHAFILRVLMEVKPDDSRIDGMILWLLLNKKFNQWKSTRTTAEVVYSLTSALKAQGALAVREKAVLTVGGDTHKFVFEPDVYSGENTQIRYEGDDITGEKFASTKVSKEGKGYMFASVTWHYSTEKLPAEARGDFMAVTRKFFLRKNQGGEMVLLPLSEGTPLSVGDQVEVHLSIRCKHPMEYIHLRDPRGAGFEPEKFTSGYHWDLGLAWYEEIRDSGTNFFFEWLPQGEYSFKYRLRATMAGTFRVGPATLQSMYAPEFGAFSSGKMIAIEQQK